MGELVEANRRVPCLDHERVTSFKGRFGVSARQCTFSADLFIRLRLHIHYGNKSPAECFANSKLYERERTSRVYQFPTPIIFDPSGRRLRKRARHPGSGGSYFRP